MAGVSRLQYTSEARFIRVMCSGRVDPEFVLRAFLNGTDGVFIAGCRLGECNYVTQGNYHALDMVLLLKCVMEHAGIDSERLTIRFMSSGEGNVFVETVNTFVEKVRGLGPMGSSENLNKDLLKLKLKSIERILPYLKLVQSESLAVRMKTRTEHVDYFNNEETRKVIDQSVLEKLNLSQIIGLLREEPRSTGEIAEILGLNPSEVSRHIKSSSRQGLVRYDESLKRFAAA
jgi:F420-non-reducing hydrogenase iron-sulfur subunit